MPQGRHQQRQRQGRFIEIERFIVISSPKRQTIRKVWREAGREAINNGGKKRMNGARKIWREKDTAWGLGWEEKILNKLKRKIRKMQ